MRWALVPPAAPHPPRRGGMAPAAADEGGHGGAPSTVQAGPLVLTRSDGASGFMGVYVCGPDRYKAVACNITLGFFDTAEEAAMARARFWHGHNGDGAAATAAHLGSAAAAAPAPTRTQPARAGGRQFTAGNAAAARTQFEHGAGPSGGGDDDGADCSGARAQNALVAGWCPTCHGKQGRCLRPGERGHLSLAELAAAPSSELAAASVDEWAQCDACGKWRRLPPGVSPPQESVRWQCAMIAGGSCDAPEEEEEEAGAEALRQAAAEGLELERSHGATGFRGVYPSGSRFKAMAARLPGQAAGEILGVFGTAHEVNSPDRIIHHS